MLCAWSSASLTLCVHFVGMTDGSDSKGITLKPAVSRSASQRLLATSRPMPPIQNRLPSPEPSWTSNKEQEHEENGTGCGGSEGNHKELMSEVKGCKVKKTSQIIYGEFSVDSCRQTSEIFSPWCEPRVAAEPRKNSAGCCIFICLCSVHIAGFMSPAYMNKRILLQIVSVLSKISCCVLWQRKTPATTQSNHMCLIWPSISFHSKIQVSVNHLCCVHGCYCCRHASVLVSFYTSSVWSRRKKMFAGVDNHANWTLRPRYSHVLLHSHF